MLPFLSEQYCQHLTSQHIDNWANYHLLDLESKKNYSDDKEVGGIHQFVDNAKDNLEFVIHRSSIVNFLIGELFFNIEHEEDDDSTPITKANAMKLFRIQEDGSYFDTFKNLFCFWLAIDDTSIRLSFRQTAAVIIQHQNRCKNHKLVGLSDHMVGQFGCILVVVAVIMIANVIAYPSVWAFALAADASIHFEVPMLVQRARMCFKGNLINLHLVLIHFFKTHIVVNYIKLMSAILDAMYSSWRDKLMSISFDGDDWSNWRRRQIASGSVHESHSKNLVCSASSRPHRQENHLIC
jgi:hypothetical protein